MRAPYILVVDDEPGIRDLVKEILEDEGYLVKVADSARSARNSKAEKTPDLVLLDIWMPGEDGISLLKEWRNRCELVFPVVMMSGHGTIETAVEATRLGAYDFVEKPLSLAKLLQIVKKAINSARQNAQYADETPKPNNKDQNLLIGRSQYIESLREQIDKLSKTNVNVLVSGETATGKTRMLRHIHQNSARANKPFISVHCDQLDKKNMAVELFGSEHTSTVTKGALAQAQGGVLHLDEVRQLPTQVQSLLLNAIKSRHFARIGGSRAQSFDVRLMISSSVDLQCLLISGEFNQALYYALNMVPIHTLGLREHPEDISALLEYYVDRLITEASLTYRHFTVAAQNRLRNYTWPGNVRELKNLVQQLLVMGRGVEIELDEVENALLGHQINLCSTPGLISISLDLSMREARAEFERSYLYQQLKAVGGSVSELSKRAGLERTHLYRKLRRLGVKVGKLHG